MANIGALTAHIELNTRGLRGDMARSRMMFQRFSSGANRSLGTIVRSVGRVQTALVGMGVVLGAGALVRSITRIGVEFDQTMTTVAGIMRATTEEMNMLTEAARRMGETTEFTASQAGQALRFLGMAGFEAAEATAALPGVLDLATAGTLELGRSADIASNALTAMQLPVAELSRVNDVFIGTITRSNVNMEQMAESFKYSAPVAKAFGYSIEELAGMIGILGNAGVQGSMAGTQLAMSMQRANEVAGKFKYTSADLLDVLESMRKEGRTNADIMDLFGQRAGRAALILMDATDETKAFQETLGGVQGEAKRLADIMRSTVGGAFKELKSVIESVAIDAFETYKDELEDTVRAMIHWIRENKTAIVALIGGTMDAIASLIDAFRVLWAIVAAIPSGVIDFFDNLGEATREAADDVAAAGEKMRNAFAPPDATPWQEFAMVVNQTGMNILRIVTFLARTIANTFAALAKFIVSDILWNLALAIYDFFEMVTSGIMLNFAKLQRELLEFRDDFVNMWKEGDKTGEAMFKSWADAWKDMQGSLDFRTAAEMWKDSFKTNTDDIAKLGDELDKAGDKAVHTAKDVSRVTTGSSEEAANAIGGRLRLLNMEISLYEELLSQNRLTATQMTNYWQAYYDKRKEMIEAEAAMLEDLGVATNLIADIVKKRSRDLSREMHGMLDDSGTSLRQWAISLSADLTHTFEDLFFGTMKGQFKSFYDYIEAITDVFLRDIARMAAQELSKILGLSYGYGGGGGGGGGIGFNFNIGGGGGGGSSEFGGSPGGRIKPMQTGGIAMRPILARIGEVPEAVIPLSKMNNPNFLQSLGLANAAAAPGPTINLTMNVATPDVSGFRASQSQILAQAMANLRRAGGRNL